MFCAIKVSDLVMIEAAAGTFVANTCACELGERSVGKNSSSQSFRFVWTDRQDFGFAHIFPPTLVGETREYLVVSYYLSICLIFVFDYLPPLFFPYKKISFFVLCIPPSFFPNFLKEKRKRNVQERGSYTEQCYRGTPCHGERWRPGKTSERRN